MLKSILWDYSDPYILVSRTLTAPNKGTVANPNNRKNIRIKNCPPFTDYISEINNATTDNAKDTDIVMPIFHLIEYIDNSFETSGR